MNQKTKIMSTDIQFLKTQYHLHHDWRGRFAFEEYKREIINEVTTEVLEERKRIAKLSLCKRIFKRFDL